MKSLTDYFGKSPSSAKRAVLYLVRPSNYDEEGYVVRYLRGVLPSNTLGCLYTLTQQAAQAGVLGEVDLQVRLIDEMVASVPLRNMARLRRKGQAVIVCLAGVQSNQFPRAADLAKQLRKQDVTVLIGGFHVSGILASGLPIPSDIQELLEIGVTVVKGEVEDTWGGLLRAAIEGRLQPLYDFLAVRPELAAAPIPCIPKGHLKHFVSTNFNAVDCGRGCPFQCSFCCVIAVQGRKMRFRSPERIAEAMRENYRRNKTEFYFLTDDNFSRNRYWEAIFDAMIRLREEENIPLRFTMQVDVPSYLIPGFLEKARRAGCNQVFIGIESVNPANLQAVGKSHNKREDYRRLIDAYRQAEISVHAGYILGLPHDTPESLRRDIRFLMEEVQVDQVSFFILTPLPGSRDHEELRKSQGFLEADYNRYEYFHETMRYPGFPEKGSLVEACLEAWSEFYEFSNMRRILERVNAKFYWDTLRNYLWYRSAVEIERRHPMMVGYFRRKSRREIRPDRQPLSRAAFLKKRLHEMRRLVQNYLWLIFETQLLWLCTRHRLQASPPGAPGPGESLRVGETSPSLWHPFFFSAQPAQAQTILEFWRSVRQDWRQRRWRHIPWGMLACRLFVDGKLAFSFFIECSRQMGGFFRTFFPGNSYFSQDKKRPSSTGL